MHSTITSWGRYPVIKAEEYFLKEEKDLLPFLTQKEQITPRGNARSYGDSSLGKLAINSTKYSKIVSFDDKKGIIYCESGLLFSDVLDFLVPKGWFLPVTPGTKFITVGGAVASDVHGKNHHVDGSFSNHIIDLEMLCADGNVRKCSKTENSELFSATCGGMGLTGFILRVRFRVVKIESSYIKQIQVKAKNLDEIISLFEEYQNTPYTMAWIDCLKAGKSYGRSILIAGDHAKQTELSERQRRNLLQVTGKKKITMPFDLPSFTLNVWSIKAFNALYYAKNTRKEIHSITHYEGFFYPLDAILHWNRMYGKRGFLQYQFVLPLDRGREGLTKILEKIRKKGYGSFLAVLKLFGEQNDLISFPMKGYTLALDFPIKKGLFTFLDEVDQMVLEYGGRIYLTKDARMKERVFWKSYPRAQEFVEVIRKYDPDKKFASLQSKRLGIS